MVTRTWGRGRAAALSLLGAQFNHVCGPCPSSSGWFIRAAVVDDFSGSEQPLDSDTHPIVVVGAVTVTPCYCEGRFLDQDARLIFRHMALLVAAPPCGCARSATVPVPVVGRPATTILPPKQ